jgi:predicted PurR-regulated permease PerM
MVYYSLIILALAWIAFLYLPAISSLILGALLAYLLHPAAVFLNQKLRLNYTLSVWLVFISFIVVLDP